MPVALVLIPGRGWVLRLALGVSCGRARCSPGLCRTAGLPVLAAPGLLLLPLSDFPIPRLGRREPAAELPGVSTWTDVPLHVHWPCPHEPEWTSSLALFSETRH